MKKLALVILLIAFSPLSSFAEDLVIATFNCEFLIRDKVNYKFSDGSDDQWSKPTSREQKFKRTIKGSDLQSDNYSPI